MKHIEIYIYMTHEFDKGMRELNKYKNKKLLKVKPQAEVLAFGAYMFENQVKFANSRILYSGITMVSQARRVTKLIT